MKYNMKWKELGPAYLAGICGAAGSVLGKLSGMPFIENFMILRLLCVLLMITVNTYVLTLFMRALHQSGSTLLATVVTNASSFLSSAIFGYLFFEETSSLLWWLGLLFIIGGLLLIVQDEKPGNKNNDMYKTLDKDKHD
ncbi:transmembrane protein 42-like [Coccinella septempunctata]|uniref:transmembrane protein 42-like n=1 Tax=Coccinella septempunctata TaxID=41139 RepID=UPI001D09076D|nr:transmembrane protein 42-like [Coccinella septempunctata]